MDTIVVVCSKNKAKNTAVDNIIKQFFKEYKIISFETQSGISETPIGDDEGIQGCFNRINDALSQEKNGDLYVAMEGILTNTKYGTFICGWTVIYNKNCNEYYYGCSSKVKVPDGIIKMTNKSLRLSDIVGNYFNCSGDEISNYGTNGVLTNGVYTRTNEFMDSILCAISSKYKKLDK